MAFYIISAIVLLCLTVVVAFLSLRYASEENHDFVWRKNRLPNAEELSKMKALGLTQDEIDLRTRPGEKPGQ